VAERSEGPAFRRRHHFFDDKCTAYQSALTRNPKLETRNFDVL